MPQQTIPSVGYYRDESFVRVLKQLERLFSSTPTYGDILAYFQSCLSLPRGETARADVERLVRIHNYPAHKASVDPRACPPGRLEDVAARLHGCFTDLEIIEVSDTAQAVTRLVQNPHPELLTDRAITRQIEVLRGGPALLARTTPAKIRAFLAKSFDARPMHHVGHELLEPFLSDPDVDETVLARANEVLIEFLERRPGFAEFKRALALTQSSAQDTALQQLFEHVPHANTVSVAVAPVRTHAKSRFEQYLMLRPTRANGAIGSLVEVLSVKRYNAHASTVALRDLVWKTLVDRSGLLARRLDPVENLERLRALTGVDDLLPAHVGESGRLYGLVRGAVARSEARIQRVESIRFENPGTRQPASQASEAIGFLTALAAANDGYLPRPSALSDEKLVEISQALGGRSYDSDLVALLGVYGFAPPRYSSSNEEHMSQLLTQLSRPVNKVTPQARPDYLPAGQSIDFLVECPKGKRTQTFLVECQGQQHFRSLSSEKQWYSHEEQMERDKAKFAAVMATDQSNLVMLAIHHSLTSGSAKLRLTASQLESLMDYAGATSARWLYAGPQDSIKSVPGIKGHKKILCSKFDPNFPAELIGLEVVAIRPDL
jgi:hypothetical protein